LNLTLANVNVRSLNTTEGFVRPEGDRIEVAYGIAAGWAFLNAIAFLVLLFCFPRPAFLSTRKQSFKEVCNPTSCIKGDQVVGILIIVFLFFFWGMPIGAERAYGKFILRYSNHTSHAFSYSGKFIFVYAVKGPLHMAKSTGTILETVFWVTFTGGRFGAIILSKFISPTKMLMGDFVITIIATSLLVSLQGNAYILWICTGVFASMISPVFPASIAWANLYIDMTPMATSIAFISSATCDLAYSWISGTLMEYKGPPSLMYFMLTYALISSTLFAILAFLGRLHQSRVHAREGEVVDEAKVNGAKEVEMDLMEKK
jgi:FHS family Na+ dependent glucose MFS transporter 1